MSIELIKNVPSKLECYFFNKGYDAYLNQDFEDIVLTVCLLDNDTVALDSYNNGLKHAYKDNNIGNHIGK